MIEPPIPANEAERLAALHELRLLDTPPEERFERIIRIASAAFSMPMAFISLVDADRQWFKARCGLADPSTPRSLSFCAHAILETDPLIVPDTHHDPRFADHPLVLDDPMIRFYAGYPLSTVDGFNIGTFCVADSRPRQLSARELDLFRDLALSVQDEINLQEFAQIRKQLRLMEDQLRLSNAALEQSNKLIRHVFGRYMTDDVARHILDSADSLKLGGELRSVTILVCDVRGFTPLTRRLPPEQVVRLLNRFLGRMIDLIIQAGGSVDQILGDGILAIFGAPLDLPDRSRAAVACALEMQAALGDINAESAAEGLPELACGIGISSGPVVVGNIGSEQRMKYSVIGNAVNLAARIESLCSGGQVLVSESVRDELAGAFPLAPRAPVRVKGLDDPITVYEVAPAR